MVFYKCVCVSYVFVRICILYVRIHNIHTHIYLDMKEKELS